MKSDRNKGGHERRVLFGKYPETNLALTVLVSNKLVSDMQRCRKRRCCDVDAWYEPPLGDGLRVGNDLCLVALCLCRLRKPKQKS